MSSERFAKAKPFSLPDVAATHALAERLARQLPPGGVLALVGELGAGKTEFARGFAQALGVPSDQPVTSPSFVLLQTYEGKHGALAHFDAYFSESEVDLEHAGFHDLRKQGARVVVIEVNDNPNIDSGNEDAILKNELYLTIMRGFLERVERKKAAGVAR